MVALAGGECAVRKLEGDCVVASEPELRLKWFLGVSSAVGECVVGLAAESCLEWLLDLNGEAEFW